MTDFIPEEARDLVLNTIIQPSPDPLITWDVLDTESQADLILTNLYEAGWRLLYPPDFPGLCGSCKTIIKEGTVHSPFNGNQMFACQVRNKGN